MRDLKTEALLAALRGEEPLPPPIPEPPAPPAVAEPAPPSEPPAQPDMLVFLQTKVELLERKLEEARRDAMRAEVTLKEREEAQRRATREVESLFVSMREQTRATAWDKALRDQLVSERERVKELEERLRSAAIAALSPEGGPPAPPLPPVPPYSPESEVLAAMIGRMADLERRLEDSEAARKAGSDERQAWEESILHALKGLPTQWKRQGGPEALVEATLQSLVDTMRERERLGAELKKILSALDHEPPDSPDLDNLRRRSAACRARINELQNQIEKQSSVVEAWVKRQETAPPA